MKNYLIYTTLLATALISSCSNEDEPSVATQGTPISFTIDNNGVTTKTSTAAESSTYKTTFTSGDQIGVYAQANSGVLATANPYNVLYTVNAGATAITSTTPIMMNTGTATFYAYSPYTSNGADNSKVTFTVQEDQREQTNFNASNFLTGTQTITVANESNNTTGNLTFTARLALLRIAISGEFGKLTSAVTVKAKKTITWTPGANSDVSVDDNSTANIQMYKETTADNATEIVFTAFVPAQTISSGTTMLNMTIEDRNYVYKPSSDKVLAAGKVNKLSIEIDTDPILIASSGLEPEVIWTDNEITDNGGEVENNLILECANITSPATNFNNLALGEWGLVRNRANYTFGEYSVSNGTITIPVIYEGAEGSESAGNWSNLALVYHAKEQLNYNKSYQLSFNATSTATTAGDDEKIQVVLIYHTSSLNYPYKIETNYTKYLQTTTSSGLTQCTIYPNEIGTAMNNTSWTTNSQYKDFHLVFSFIGKKSATYTIKDIKLTAISGN